jgi:hypothetical protein
VQQRDVSSRQILNVWLGQPLPPAAAAALLALVQLADKCISMRRQLLLTGMSFLFLPLSGVAAAASVPAVLPQLWTTVQSNP